MSMIELLVVIAIIAILISLLIPSLRRSYDFASSTLCMHNLRELGHALMMYRIENDGWLPQNVVEQRVDYFEDGAEHPEAWFVKLYPAMLTDPMVLSCPKDPYRQRFHSIRERLTGPEAADYASYGINGFIMNVGNGFLANMDRHVPTRPLDTLLLADLGPDDPEQSIKERNTKEDDQPVDQAPVAYDVKSRGGTMRNIGKMLWDDGYRPFINQTRKKTWLTMRHGDGINTLTLGGGVREARTKEIRSSLVRSNYPFCAWGGCTLCKELRIVHYTFARSGLYWWTGPIPKR